MIPKEGKFPFLKGGFRGLSGAYYNPPCPALEKGGISLRLLLLLLTDY
jgi:hypothetical protein